jgi:hypothetical protein
MSYEERVAVNSFCSFKEFPRQWRKTLTLKTAMQPPRESQRVNR